MVMKHILMDVYNVLNKIHFSNKGCKRGALTSHEIYNDIRPF